MGPPRFRRALSVIQRRQPDLTVLVERLTNAHNIGAILRTSDAVGIAKVHTVMSSDLFSAKALRSTAKGSDRWTSIEHHTTTEGAYEKIRNEGLQIVAADVTPHAQDFREVDYTKPTCIVMGRESTGISEYASQHADFSVTIPQFGMVESLNVSVATGLILYEAQRQRSLKGMYEKSRLTPELHHRLVMQFVHPEVYQYCMTHSIALPNIDEEGTINDPVFEEARQSLSQNIVNLTR